MKGRPQVLIVGGMAFNLPKELLDSVDVVKHIEQSSSFHGGALPHADYILVISEFASHNIVSAVKNQLNVPVVSLPRGWSGMRQELIRRSILPPDLGPTTQGPEAAEAATPTTTGLSEDELWKRYRNSLIQAAKGALKPRELVSEKDLLDILGDLVGVPPEDVRLLLPKLHMGGIVVPVQEGVWSLMIGEDSYDFDTSPAAPKTRRKESPKSSQEEGIPSTHVPRERSFDRARKIAGLPTGPYRTIVAIIREMQKYKEFQHEDGTPLSVEGCRRLVQKATELKLIDDTHTNIFIDHKPEIILTKPVKEPEPAPVPQPALTAEGEREAIVDAYKQLDAQKSLSEMTKEQADGHWAYIVNEVKRQKRHLGTILENGRIEWLPSTSILIFLVPQEFSPYLNQLESTENWGLISSLARSRFGQAVVIRFVLDNGLKKARA